MKRSGAGVTAHYALIQSLYWVTSGMMFNYASVFLLDRGFSNSRIGMVLGLSYAFSACIQPVLATIFGRIGKRLSSSVFCIYIAIGTLAALNFFLPLNGVALMVLMITMMTLQNCLQPSMNSLHRGYELSGVAVNFGLARGMGSAAFSLMCFAVGYALNRVSPRMLPGFYLCTIILLMICLITFRSPVIAQENEKKNENSGSLLRRNPRFLVFLAGLVCLSWAHIFIDNFMLQVMQRVGGNSENLGISIAVAAIVELPAMMFYASFARRIDGFFLLKMSGWMWLLKDMLIMLAPNPGVIYAAQLLQFFSYAMYVPATVDYIARTMPQGDFLKGQAFSGSAFTMGSLLATLLGGVMIDHLGMNVSLVIMQVLAFTGSVLFTIAIPRGLKKR